MTRPSAKRSRARHLAYERVERETVGTRDHDAPTAMIVEIGGSAALSAVNPPIRTIMNSIEPCAPPRVHRAGIIGYEGDCDFDPARSTTPRRMLPRTLTPTPVHQPHADPPLPRRSTTPAPAHHSRAEPPRRRRTPTLATDGRPTCRMRHHFVPDAVHRSWHLPETEALWTSAFVRSYDVDHESVGAPAPVTTERATGPAIVHDGLPARPPLPQWVQTVLMS